MNDKKRYLKQHIKKCLKNIKKKNSYVTKFSTIEKLDKTTINDVAKTLFKMGINISQLMAYPLRWTE